MTKKQCPSHSPRLPELVQLEAGPEPRIEETAEADLRLWKEALFGADLLLLLASPVYYGLGVPRGDGSAVVLIPGFLTTDHYLAQLRSWIERIGYRAYYSGIGLNAECPNLLIKQILDETLATARAESGRKVHLVGHSLGGVIARSLAAQHPRDVASVITLGSPFHGAIAHRSILRMAEIVRRNILREHGSHVLPQCYTAHCTCDFLSSLRQRVPRGILQTAIFTRSDGVVDPRCCCTGVSRQDFEVPGTHIGLAFNASAYTIIGRRLAEARAITRGPKRAPR